jgi:hypothetical protein
MFIPPFSTDSETGTWDDELDSEEEEEEEEDYDVDNLSEGMLSRLANPHLSDRDKSGNTYPNRKLSLGDEEDEVEDEDEVVENKEATIEANIPEGEKAETVSSLATAGGEESGYSSSLEDNNHPNT